MQKANVLFFFFLLSPATLCLAQAVPSPAENGAPSVPQSTGGASNTGGGFTPHVQPRPALQPNAVPVASEPASPAPAPAGYRLNPGDTLQLDFRLSPELNQTVILDPDGTVGLLVVGRVHLAGLTLPEARQLLLAKESEHLVKPEINIQLTNYLHLYVMVAGEVYIPQRIEMREAMTALQAVEMAGGCRTTGRETSVLLYRRINDQIAEVHKLNLKIKKNSQIEHDMALQPGDLLVVQRTKVESVARYTRIVGLNYPIATPAY
jgi:polysaccharide export outer membrane protein